MGDGIESSENVSTVELLSEGGFALFFGWMFIVFYWLFCDFPPSASLPERDLTQLFVFAAVPVGYIVIHVLGRNPKFNVFSRPFIVGEAVCAVALPVTALVMYQGVDVAPWLICFVNFLAGAAAAGMKLSWLDVCSRLKIAHHGRFTGLSLFAGGLLFVLVSFSPDFMQPLFGIIYFALSVGLLVYSTAHAPGNDERAPLESVAETWRFTAEIEPSFFMFGVVFGITFVFLFNSGKEPVQLGLISTLVGSLAVAILSIADRQLSITGYQRVLVVIAVLACVIMPLVSWTGRLLCAYVTTATWAMFLAVNYGYIVKKCVVAREAPLFRQAPLRLMVPSLGFACGWAVAACLTALGVDDIVFTYMRLTVAVLLVVAIMVFFPSRTHHPIDGTSPDRVQVQTTVIAADKSDQDLFEARCEAVAKLYQLSPRETEILGYLAKGRNAAHIQEELVISPHTVKSHIYNIYRKVDIHSQQKLMDFIETFPLD